NKMLGLALIDYNNDNWPDVLAANDTQPNRLYHNNGNGTFKDVAVTAGVAFSEAGTARAGMGVDAADFDGSGRQGLVIGNFSNEMIALYANEGNGLFIDLAPNSTIGKVSQLTLTFATFFFDYDLDGLLDIFAANGHVADDIGKVQKNVTYAQPSHLFRNTGGKKFDAVTAQVGSALTQAVVARGAAYGDYDNDGDLDLVITANNGPARLLRNSGSPNNVLRVTTIGTTSNRDGIGAKVRIFPEGAPARWAVVKTGSSYCSQSELPLTFGLGRAPRVTKMEVTWPNGKTESLPGVAANQTITIQEGKGVIRTAPIAVKAR
ncbi:MAG TPA: CRTAC1 family protein, partial [Vicinamibacterales bacterium]|nr:CRTAC1 family protein [Vicinamibacterales bacterium]